MFSYLPNYILSELNKFGLDSIDEVRLRDNLKISVIVKGKNLNEIARFIAERLSTIDGVQSVATHFILKKYKIEGQTAIKINEPERQMVL